MEVKNLKTYNTSPERAFETLCSQLFESWLKREYLDISYFTVVNGAGGDGGVEAYAIRENQDIIGLQAKWFLQSINKSQITQIEKSINTALTIRPSLRLYVVCIPRNPQSRRRGKGGKVQSETEESRLNSLKAKLESKYHGLTIEYWYEKRIITELSHPSNDGLIKLWFEKEEISFDTLVTRFRVAKTGWLSDRYFPELHNRDTISKVVNEITVSDQYLKEQLGSVQGVILKLEKSISLINRFLEVNIDSELKKELVVLANNLRLGHSHYVQLLNEIKQNCLNSSFEFAEVHIYPITRRLSEASVPNRLKEDQIKLRRLLDDLHQIHLPQYLNSFHQDFRPHNYIILGPAGSGKTHAFAFEIEDRLAHHLPSLLIRAKDCKNLSWKMILSDTLQACSDWSDIQIFSSLSSMARSASVSRASDEEDKLLNQNVKFLICVDGIDESDEPVKWRELINETKVWINRFPNITFLFSCRNYPPMNQDPFSLHCNDDQVRRKDLISEDLDIYFDYLSHFGIKYEKMPWLISSFENRLSLRLFCEEYKGMDLGEFFPNPVFNTTRALLKRKIERLEREFLVSLGHGFSINDQLVARTLELISSYFTEENVISRDRLRSSLSNDLKNDLTSSQIGLLLDKLSDNGFLLCRSITSDDSFTIHHEYEPGIQSYFDYLLANRYTKTIVQGNLKNIPITILEKRYGDVRELVALGLLTDHNKLVGQDGLWTQDLSELELLQLQFKVLAKAPTKLYEKYKPFLKQLFLDDRDRFVRNFALPNANREDLNIIEGTVHKTLLEFPNVFERDQFWSGPDNHDVEGHSHLSYCFEYDTLYYLSKPKYEPLLFSWALSSTSNTIRDKIKTDLTSWALKDLADFVELLDILFFACKDPQIQEDLAGVIYGLAALINLETSNIDKLQVWIQDNIFDLDRIVNIRSSVIRHACRCFMERISYLGLCDGEAYSRCIPPYPPGNNLLGYVQEGEIGRDGLYPIENDLYWENIEDAYREFVEFRKGGQPNEEMSTLLNHHKFSGSPKDFFTRAALQFITDLGWNKSDGFGNIGNGKFCTFEEKYTTLAVHNIQGFLADHLPFIDGQIKGKLKDYGKLLHINNPAHKELVKIEYLSLDAIKWYVPEEFSPELMYSEPTIKQDIKKWTTSDVTYDFEKWLFPKKLNLFKEEDRADDDWLVLDLHLAMPEPNKIGRTWLKISSLLVDIVDHKNLVWCLNNCKRGETQFKTDHLSAGVKGYVYNSLLDVIWREQMEEYNSEILLLETNEINITAYPGSTELTEHTANKGDIHFKFPSKLLRKLLGINTSDKVSYYDMDHRVKAISHSSYENSDLQQQLLLADSKSMEAVFNESGLVPVWVCKEFRSTMRDPTVDNNNGHWQNCRIWIVVKEQTGFKPFLIHSDYYDL